ncbi:MAG: nuclear transport factor 2 family protein [Pseudomonas sp.]|uniref:nuclear transport factor 2 family protein n=1 Tax=Pseudomonas sp. TaxID=306 RepID=UPI00398254DB
MSEIEMMRHVLIEHECSRLIKRFALLNDAGDSEGLAAMFTEDGVFARPSAPHDPICGRSEILKAFRARPSRLSRHVTSNIVIDVVSPTEAHATSYIILYAAANDGQAPIATPPHLIGTFKDTLKLVEGKWFFSQRLGQVDLKLSP